ncbi:unnamed protein product [Zymoseptoria tritici ST99CH_3D7]|uniref:Uncharacterized protein n=1 Tax=Zymoseptoria tritici (strain ST99CH_3D7) TaxID=1276538 RepID=A0A1X7S3N1_ZYMT9|nr:unnamed protein product [Zymoseptoria tritici ST99CH_3D7]
MAGNGGDSIFVTPGPEDLNLGSFNPRGMAGAARMQSDEADFAQRLEGQLLLPQPLPAPTRPPQGQVNMQQARQAPFQAHISPHPQRPAAAEHTPHLTPGHGRPVQMQAAPAQAARRRQTHRQTRRGSAPSQQAPDQEPIVIPDDGDPPLVTFRFNGAVATMPKTRVTRFVKGEGSKVFQSQAHHTLIDAHEAQFKDTALVISNPKTTKGYILQMYQSSWKSKLVRSCTAKRSYLHTVEGLKDQHAWDHERSRYQTTIVEPNVRILAQAERDLAKMDALIAFLRNN